MTKDVLIRSAAPGDVPRLVKLVREYWTFEGIDGFDAGRIGSLLETLLATPALGAAWIAVAGDEAVAYLVASSVFSLEHGGLTAEIDEFFVTASLRGAGIGSALLESAEAALIAGGFTSVALEVSTTNGDARAFYKARGFEGRGGFEIMARKLPAHPALRSVLG